MGEQIAIGDVIRITKGQLASFYGKVVSVDDEARRLKAVGKFPDQPDRNEHYLNIAFSGVEKLGGAWGNRTILMIESSEEVQNLVKSSFENSDYQLIGVPNAGAAFLVFEYYQEPINLLIFDAVMPEKAGLELANLFRKLCSQLQVLFTSNHTEDVLIRHGVLDDESHFLPKPFTGDCLLHKVKEILEGTQENS